MIFESKVTLTLTLGSEIDVTEEGEQVGKEKMDEEEAEVAESEVKLAEEEAISKQ